jgi:RNase adaptor protein for sRNA GlmZ degradation
MIGYPLDDANSDLFQVRPFGEDGLWVPHYGLCKVVVFSFGYLHEDGVPAGLVAERPEFVMDVRRLFRDPHHDPAMRELTGRDDVIRARVLDQPGAIEYATAQAAAIASVVPAASTEAQARVITAGIGCAGGRHRSVVLAEAIALLLNRQGIGTEVYHLHIRRPVVNR